MKWIARIYNHSGKYDILINYADGTEYTLFNAENYRTLKEMVREQTGICLVARKHLHFMRDSGLNMAIVNACNSKTNGCCVTVEQAKDGTFNWRIELRNMKAAYQQEQIDKATPKEKLYEVFTITNNNRKVCITRFDNEIKAYSSTAAMSVVECWVGCGTIIVTHCITDNKYYTFEKVSTDNPIEGFSKTIQRENINNIIELFQMAGGVK